MPSGRGGDRSPADRVVEVVRARPVVLDAVLAVLLLAAGLALVAAGHVSRADRPAAMVVAVLAAAPLGLRRRCPLPAAAAVAVVAAVSQVAVPGSSAAVLPAVLVAGYSVVAHGPRRAGPLAAAVIVVGAALPVVRAVGAGAGGAAVSVVVIAVLVGACVWLVGALRRAQLRSVAALRERARLLERGRRDEVRLELLSERSRISREVHDVVAHSLSGIIAQADGARYAAVKDPQRAVEVLGTIAGTGREALGDVRGLLSMLRDTAPPDGPDPYPDDPAGTRARPTIDDLPALVAQARGSGLAVALATTGRARAVSPGAGLAVYRVVQEGLTNVVKHAGPGVAVDVALDWGADQLTVAVRDAGTPAGARSPAAPRGGHGLAGMRERAALHGGTLDAGPSPGGGFEVRLRLPLPAADRVDA